MIISKDINPIRLIKVTWHHILWLLALMTIFAFLYEHNLLPFTLPWLPVSIIGTAVAFYVGFKNDQAYERMWEARKVWGAIVNDSRTWGMLVDGFITNHFTDSKISEKELNAIKQRLIYRHIAWLYAHRSQLLVAAPWEHIAQSGYLGRHAINSQKKLGIGLVDDEITRIELDLFLGKDEHDRLIDAQNTATQIINEQSRDLSKLREAGIIDDFRHMRMTDVLRSFYEHQGKNERIKKFPLPRLYAYMSRYFVGIFIALLPFCMIPELLKIDNWGFWLSIPITALIGWVYVMMEIVGDYSENPFQGMANDIPMLSICRSTEIDLLEMLNKTDLPSAIEAKKGVLM